AGPLEQNVREHRERVSAEREVTVGGLDRSARLELGVGGVARPRADLRVVEVSEAFAAAAVLGAKHVDRGPLDLAGLFQLAEATERHAEVVASERRHVL